jgi:RNA polymerase sigma factor (sigma-70 family)
MEGSFKYQPDEQIWRAFKEGDESAFDYIFEKHLPLLCNYGRKCTADTDLIEDCIQDLFVEIWEKRAVLSDTTSIRFYLFKALRLRITRSVERQNRLRPKEAFTDGLFEQSTDSYETALVAVQTDLELKQSLQQAMAQLSERQKEALSLRYFNQFSSQETASIMGVSVESVYKLISNALAVLRKYIRNIYLLLVIVSAFQVCIL